MPLGLIAKKVGMSRIFTEGGEAMAVTYLAIPDHTVVRTKTKEKDGYDAVVLGVGPEIWKTRKGNEHTRYQKQKEWQIESMDGMEKGKIVNIEVLPDGAMLTITGVSKGKGFQGVMKRYHFAGGPASHGSHMKREPGSIGMRTQPGRIFRGHHMAGQMGKDQVTIRNRPMLIRNIEQKIIGVKGPVPGPNGSYVFLTIEAATKAVSP
ncbi:50S ribosomal protein L3 [Candidatus Peribacteria bacterium RIFCSPLOWO2_12_FULL_55_15]|nr:MAG: 50S ribosomal protein L3 [Candidatus Peribacteria bacterium RIFCSPHIGHO2_01_FULL_54_22]OGJ63030.1 MAG: 50S ribosomal protein L3 [Candidatus Peribacteria bacterium RIFCSPHIGHO2_02_FULL_55_24]OGJ63935.1 MAG: 50S ribosomal protein L3 [Candidatus Peribacteria bacterium RIFCSPHIGHO2_12_FULL_54_10]OGJ71402.1 MAG: 50S ribosomal protein L3 [Candidatus Peribacteria bacterium RIFCSPLOWO2_12_FULL_55_15]